MGRRGEGAGWRVDPSIKSHAGSFPPFSILPQSLPLLRHTLPTECGSEEIHRQEEGLLKESKNSISLTSYWPSGHPPITECSACSIGIAGYYSIAGYRIGLLLSLVTNKQVPVHKAGKCLLELVGYTWIL